MSEKIDLDKFDDDNAESVMLAKADSYSMDDFPEGDRMKVLDMQLKHDLKIRQMRAIRKIILSLLSFIPTLLLFLQNLK